MAVGGIDCWLRETREDENKPESKKYIKPVFYRMTGLTRDGTTEPVSWDRETIFFKVQLTTRRMGIYSCKRQRQRFRCTCLELPHAEREGRVDGWKCTLLLL